MTDSGAQQIRHRRCSCCTASPRSLAILGAGGALLARHFTVVCADLRGYGDSAKPRCLPDRVFYAARM
jgi:pimeloyl-ACP methyl ester carboxylesterase